MIYIKERKVIESTDSRNKKIIYTGIVNKSSRGSYRWGHVRNADSKMHPYGYTTDKQHPKGLAETFNVLYTPRNSQIASPVEK